MTRPIIVRASRAAETLDAMAEDKHAHFTRDPSRQIPSDVKREMSDLRKGAECLRYFGGPDRVAFGHLCRTRDALAALMDADTPTSRDEALANAQEIRREVTTFTEGEDEQ